MDSLPTPKQTPAQLAQGLAAHYTSFLSAGGHFYRTVTEAIAARDREVLGDRIPTSSKRLPYNHCVGQGGSMWVRGWSPSCIAKQALRIIKLKLVSFATLTKEEVVAQSLAEVIAERDAEYPIWALPVGARVEALSDLDPEGANVKKGDKGTVFELWNAYGDSCGPMVKWDNAGVCNVYPGHVKPLAA